jgi:tRNA (guanine26-N2/guanine27-N2)-dimethyltransferase
VIVVEEQVSSLTVNGPLWTGPLHNTDDVKKMIEMAQSWGWIEGDRGSGDDRRRNPPVSTKDRNLKKLLDIMLEESNPDLQVGYIELDEVLNFLVCCAYYNDLSQ